MKYSTNLERRLDIIFSEGRLVDNDWLMFSDWMKSANNTIVARLGHEIAKHASIDEYEQSAPPIKRLELVRDLWNKWRLRHAARPVPQSLV